MRRRLTFICEGVECAASLDEGSKDTGLLIVSGGNEVLAGAHRGMAILAKAICQTLEMPVFRFDRRGIGDSFGGNGGYRASHLDIACAVAAFRQNSGVSRIVAFGNCDAATALALFGGNAGIDALILANPWTFDENDGEPSGAASPADLPTASSIRARYRARLSDPRQLWRLLSGKVDYRKLWRGLLAARSVPTNLSQTATDMFAALSQSPAPARILLAERDRTAMAFSEAWAKAPRQLHAKIPVHSLASASHSFADDAAKAWLFDQIVDALNSARP